MGAPARIVRTLFAGAVCAAALTSAGLAQRGQRAPEPPPVEPLRFRYMGPASAGRIASVAGVPGDTTTYYAGAASGGIWKSTDSGKTFTPIFDDQPVQAIGALAVAASDPKIVWAGTGEAWAIRDSDVMGDGVYKSVDAGDSWKHMGLGETGRIGRIIVHPTDPNIVYVCALGRTTGPQQERGVYKTTDGGQTWRRSLFADPNTGCSGLTIDAHDPNVLFAGTWQVEMHTWAELSGGPGSAVYMTRDGGTTWKKLEAGLPKPPVGKIDVAVAPSDSKRVYALIQTPNQGSLWRSDDGGTAWRVVSWDRTLIGRAGYYIRVEVNPGNADEVMIANSSFHRSTDGGLTFPIGGFGGCGYGRGLFILNDITRLEQSDQVQTAADAYLYAPRPAFRQARNGSVDFFFTLKAAPATPVKLEILDRGGSVIRTIEAAGRAGLNRASWDLHYDGPRRVALRTTPPDNPHIWEEPRFKGKDTRPIVHWGIEQAAGAAPIAAPGPYTVRLTANGQSLTRPIDVLKDPAIPSSDADLAASTKAQLRIRDDLNTSVDMINQLEMMRKQIEDQLKAGKAKAAGRSLSDIDQKLMGVELRLLSRTDLHSDDKWYVEAYKIYMNLVWLNGVVGNGAGDVQGGADYRPTDASLAVLDSIEKDLAAARADFLSLMDKDVPAFNRSITGSGLAPLVARQAR